MKLKRQIIIKANSAEEEFEIANSIHEQLVGNSDYIDCRIILNLSADRRDGTTNEVHLDIFEDATTEVDITVRK